MGGLLVRALLLTGGFIACTPATSQGTLHLEFSGGNAVEGPAGADLFVDGWTLRFTRLLVTVSGFVVRDAARTVGAHDERSHLVDLVPPGPHAVADIRALPATYASLEFALGPAVPQTVAHGVDEATLGLMVDGGYSVLAEGVLSRGAQARTFSWPLRTSASYAGCRSKVELTGTTPQTIRVVVHGEQMFQEALGATPVRLRAQAQADADADGDGRVTVEELAAVSGDAFRALEWPRAGVGAVDNLRLFEEVALAQSVRMVPESSCRVSVAGLGLDGGLAFDAGR